MQLPALRLRASAVKYSPWTVAGDRFLVQAAGPCESVDGPGPTVSNPLTQAQVQAIANKLDESIDALRRV